MKKKNFTLVELLCATALVVILAGIGFSAYSYASYRGKEAATKSLIARVGAGLETLKTKHGFYPATTTSGTGSNRTQNFARIIITMDNNGIISAVKFKKDSNLLAEINDPKKVKDFLAVADAENIKKNLVLDSGTDYFLTDSWGGKIYYAYPGFFNTVKFDIIAPGADGEFTTSNQSTPGSSISNYKDTNSNEWNCDDIANFK